MCGWHGDGICSRTQGRSSRRDAPFFSSQARHKIFHSSFTIDLFHYRAARFWLGFFFFSLCLSPICSGRSDITTVHLDISNQLAPPPPPPPPTHPCDREAASETARLTGAGWTNSARHENDGRRERERKRLSEWRRGCCSLLRWAWWLHPHSAAEPKPLRGLWNVKTYFFSLYSTTLRQRSTFFSPLLLLLLLCPHPSSRLPWTLLTSLFPEAWKHNISQPATPTGTQAQRWKCKEYVLLDSWRQINLNMYFGHVCASTASPGGFGNDYVT